MAMVKTPVPQQKADLAEVLDHHVFCRLAIRSSFDSRWLLAYKTFAATEQVPRP